MKAPIKGTGYEMSLTIWYDYETYMVSLTTIKISPYNEQLIFNF
jgi:hypothetical protein